MNTKEAAETLEVLIRLREWVRNPWGEDDGPENESVIDEADAAIAKAKAAIAKATTDTD